jgi:glycerol-3-phosphate dehydrogenase
MIKDYDAGIIGGGILGLGIALKAAALGYNVVLFDKGEIGSGTSSHFHEMLHSGARYAVIDPVSAKECYEENQRLSGGKSPIKDSIEQMGGLFLAITDADVNYANELITSCRAIGIPVEEVTVGKILTANPRISKRLKRVLLVPDGHINGKKVLEYNATVAKENGAVLLPNHRVTGLVKKHDRIDTLKVCAPNGEEYEIACNYVINAAGVWAGLIAKLAGLSIPLVPYRGSLIVFKEQLSEYVLNRCHKPDNGDIFVPVGNHTIFGTTTSRAHDLDDFKAQKEEIEILLRDGDIMIPGLSSYQIINTFAGIRSLFSLANMHADGREISRSFKVINHKEDGINNFVSIVGGKFTIYERVCDAVIEEMKRSI